jgi:hypothetical protein
MNSRLERPASAAKENREIIPRDCTDFVVRQKPTNLEAECVAVMLLSPLHVLNRKLRRGMTEARS